MTTVAAAATITTTVGQHVQHQELCLTSPYCGLLWGFLTLSCTSSNSRPVEGGTIAVRGSCSAMSRVCTRSVKQAAMAAGVGGSKSPAPH